MEQDRKFAFWGSPFQLILIATFLLRIFLFFDVSNPPVVIWIIDMIGMAMFGWCLYCLYIKRHRLTGLITTGVFKYTRHPMYTCLFLMDLRFWWIGEYNLLFAASAVALYASIIIATYLQENETVARFGD